MALSKKQGIAIGVGAVAVAAIVGGIVWGVTQNQPAEAAAPAELTEANVATDEIQWVRLDEPVAEAVEALDASGFEPVEPGKLTVAHSAYVPPLGYIPDDRRKAQTAIENRVRQQMQRPIKECEQPDHPPIFDQRVPTEHLPQRRDRKRDDQKNKRQHARRP